MRLRTFLCLAALASLLGVRPPTVAGQAIGDVEPLLRRLEAQEARMHQLEDELSARSGGHVATPVSTNYNSAIMTRLDALEAAVNQKDEKKEEEDEWENVSGQKWTYKVGGRIHMDYVMWAEQNDASRAEAIGQGGANALGDAQNYFEFRRLRLEVKGEGYGVYDYKLQLDFEPEFNDFEGVSLKDVFFGINYVPGLGYVRFGHFKEPFSLEELTSSNFISFMERALPNEVFVPGRKVGVAAYNHNSDESLVWAGGVFFNDIDDVLKERVTDNQGIDLTGRIVATPYFCEGGRYLLHLGAGITYAHLAFDDEPGENPVARFRARPEVHEGPRWIDTGELAVDDYYVANLEAATVWGPLSLQSELFYTKTNGILGTPDQEFWGAYAFASYFLTGENRLYERKEGCFGRVTPFTNFWIVPTAEGTDIGWGAWEVLARWSYLDLNNTPDDESGLQNDATFGLNWYWNPYTRMMFNYIHSWSNYQNGDPTAENDIVGVRLQVDF